ILKNKVELSGFITGIENVISVGIFTNTTPAYFNKNLADLAIQCFNDYSDFFKSKNINVFKDMFPLVYETRFDWEDYGYNNFTDSFNIPL
ncbi:MAG: hypothetical protein OEY67_10995, partial [Gammaproteobacteria bacterium]|nr:hypothetical protein [Gammaproteobacteria bacterium]